MRSVPIIESWQSSAVVMTDRTMYSRVLAMMSTLLRIKERYPSASVLASRSCSSRPYGDVPRSVLSTEPTVWYSCCPACVYKRERRVTFLPLVCAGFLVAKRCVLQRATGICSSIGALCHYVYSSLWHCPAIIWTVSDRPHDISCTAHSSAANRDTCTKCDTWV